MDFFIFMRHLVVSVTMQISSDSMRPLVSIEIKLETAIRYFSGNAFGCPQLSFNGLHTHLHPHVQWKWNYLLSTNCNLLETWNCI